MSNSPKKFHLGYALLAFGCLIVTGGAYLMWHLGYFREMRVEEAVLEPQMTLFVDHRGAYHKIGPSIEQVEAWAKANSFTCDRSFGEFLDNPKAVEEDRLRARAGCVLEKAEEGRLANAKVPEGFQLGTLPGGRYLKIFFAGSPAIGPWKIYPYAMGYFRDKKWPQFSSSVEIYRILNNREMTTEYLFQVPVTE